MSQHLLLCQTYTKVLCSVAMRTKVAKKTRKWDAVIVAEGIWLWSVDSYVKVRDIKTWIISTIWKKRESWEAATITFILELTINDYWISFPITWNSDFHFTAVGTTTGWIQRHCLCFNIRKISKILQWYGPSVYILNFINT